MRPALSIALTIILAYTLGLFLPWWSVTVASAIVMATMRARPLPAFLLGFLSVFIFWAAWISARSIANEHILAHRMSVMVIGKDNPWGLMALSASIGGLMGGLGGLCGSLLMRILRPDDGADDPETMEESTTIDGQDTPAPSAE
jgi:hypothetical protein